MSLPLPDHMAHYSFQRRDPVGQSPATSVLPRWEAHPTNEQVHTCVPWEQVPEDVQRMMIACSIMPPAQIGARLVRMGERNCFLWDIDRGGEIWIED